MLIARKYIKDIERGHLGLYAEIRMLGSYKLVGTAVINYLWEKDQYQIELNPKMIK